MPTDVEERTALQQAIRDMLGDLASEERIRQAAAAEHRFDGVLWAQLVQMGVLDLAVAEQREASGGSYADLAVVFEELGRALAPVPAQSTVAVSTVLDLSGSEAAVPWLSELLAGRSHAALVMTGDGSTWGWPTPVRAQRRDERWTVTGTVESVSDGARADAFVVLAETSDGPAFFLVVSASEAVSVVTRDALDLTRPLVDVSFSDASATPLCSVADTPGVTRRVLDVCSVLLAAEQVGVAQRALDTAVGYAKVRVQFDRAIGSFQAVKHSCVDMLMLVEGARCLVSSAAAGLDEDDPTEAAVRAGIAAAYAAEAAVECGERCLQIHGGIGFTWEHVTHLLLRKAKSDAVRFGRPWEHWERVTDQLTRLAGDSAAGL